MNTLILTTAGIALLAIASVGCKTEVAPQAVIDPTATPNYNQAPMPNQAPVYNNDPGPGPDSYPAYATRRYVRKDKS